MKNLVLTILGILMSIYVIGTCLCVFSLETRKNALEENVSRVIIRTLEDNYQKKNVTQVCKKLEEELKLDVGKNGQVQVEIVKLDLEKGIIHVIVREEFRQFNGKMRTITCEKTALIDRPADIGNAVFVGAGYLNENANTASANAGIYTNAYDYYEAYEGAMIFKPRDDTEAGVFYGTRAKQSSSGKIVFRTLGWRVTVKDKAGNIMDQIYYWLNGENIQVVDSRVVDNYKYKLYNITLDNLKSRLSTAANNALKKADCSIVFDACITVVKNGVYQGGLTDDGISWGDVYTTYDGIVNAQNWSNKTKEALKSYFNKDMADMFFEVSLSCGTGIESVTGGGRYCYGTEVTIDATPQKGYKFLEWIGGVTTTSKKYTFTVLEDVAMKATTTRDDVAVNFYRNWDRKDTEMTTVFYGFGKGSHQLPGMDWEKTGYHQTGWSTSRIVLQAYFKNQQTITETWLEKVAPSVDLYAVWEPNDYRIVFDANGASGEDSYVIADYTESIILPSEGYEFQNHILSGWSMSSEQEGAEFLCGQTVSVAELANRAGVVNENGGVIYLYAQKDCAPKIYGDTIYVSRFDANRGAITAEWLSKHIYVTDVEDGRIFYEDGYGAEKPDGGFGVLDYQAWRYIQCEEETCIVERFYARDSVGNETIKEIEVYIVDDAKTIFDSHVGTIRFFSDRYYQVDGDWVSQKDGGLLDDSVWKWNKEYAVILEELYQEDVMVE